jgi:hypothetical protein
MIMKYIQAILLSWLLLSSSGCGSAEAIKSYSYATTKYNLEKAVISVINSNPHIIVDTTETKVIVRRNPNNPNDTSTVIKNLSEIYGKDSADVAANFNGVIKIKIKLGEIDNDYTFRYLGDEQYWKSSKSSAIFIQNVTDKHGNMVSQGKNENGEFDNKMAKKSTALFEREVVSKIDKELNLKHTVD